MNATIVNGSWNVVKGRLKQAYGRLARNDRAYFEGREDEVVGRLQVRAGMVWGEVSKLLRVEARQH